MKLVGKGFFGEICYDAGRGGFPPGVANGGGTPSRRSHEPFYIAAPPPERPRPDDPPDLHRRDAGKFRYVLSEDDGSEDKKHLKSNYNPYSFFFFLPLVTFL